MIDELALVLAVVYASLMCSSDSPELIVIAGHVLAAYERLIAVFDFPNDPSTTTIMLLQAHLMVTTVQTSKKELLSAHEQLPQLVRAAQFLCLHSLDDSSPDLDTEIMRWMWWHLIYLDVEAAIMTGLPTFIHHDSYSTTLPTETSIDPLSGISELVPGISISLSAMRSALIARLRWVARMQAWLKERPTLAEMDDLRKEMSEVVLSIPSTNATAWPRTYCSLLADRAICVLSQDLKKRNGVISGRCEETTIRYLQDYFSLKPCTY